MGEEKKQELKNQEPKKVKKNEKSAFSSKMNEFKGEFRKIIWPSRKDLIKQTFTVIVASLLIGVIILGLDGLYGVGLEYFTKFFG